MFTIDPLNSNILTAYKGMNHGTDSTGITDIEFPTIHHAASWAQTCDISDRVSLRRDPAIRPFFDQPVTIQLWP